MYDKFNYDYMMIIDDHIVFYKKEDRFWIATVMVSKNKHNFADIHLCSVIEKGWDYFKHKISTMIKMYLEYQKNLESGKII